MRSTFGAPRLIERFNQVERRLAGVLVDHRHNIDRP
jgi:hypothetical protein